MSMNREEWQVAASETQRRRVKLLSTEGPMVAWPGSMLFSCVGVLLIGSAASQNPPAVCSPGNPATPCSHECPTGAFDLGSFKAATPSAGFYHATDSGGHDYYFDACGAITSVTCQGSSAPDPVAVQTWGEPAPQPPSFPQDSCGALGADSTQSCHSTNASALQCDYSQGDGGRTVSIRYKCAPIATPPTASQPDQSVTHYVIDFSGPGGCAGAGGGGGGWGKLFLILFFVFTTLYFGGGFGYNYKYKDLRGAEAVPQIEYWKQVPGLVHDGCVFSYQQTSIFVAYLNEKRQGGPADPGLKRALAENEDGGESSTAYEESKA